MTAPDVKDQARDPYVVRCVGCGAWTENHWACTACDDAIHPRLCPWILRGFPRCVCNAAESQCLALGYYKGRLHALDLVGK